MPAKVHGENPCIGIEGRQFRARLARGGAEIDYVPGIQLEQRQPRKQSCARLGVNRVGIVEGGAGPPQPNQRGATVGQSEGGLHRWANPLICQFGGAGCSGFNPSFLNSARSAASSGFSVVSSVSP